MASESQDSEWLNTALNERIGDVSDICDTKLNDSYNQFMKKLDAIFPTRNEHYFALENLYISQIRLVVKTAYPLGLKDGYELWKHS